MEKVPQTLFGKQIRNNKKAHELMVKIDLIVIGCVGINVNIPACELILRTQSVMKKMKGKFDLQTAAKLQVEVDDFFGKMENDFKSEQNTVSK